MHTSHRVQPRIQLVGRPRESLHLLADNWSWLVGQSVAVRARDRLDPLARDANELVVRCEFEKTWIVDWSWIFNVALRVLSSFCCRAKIGLNVNSIVWDSSGSLALVVLVQIWSEFSLFYFILFDYISPSFSFSLRGEFALLCVCNESRVSSGWLVVVAPAPAPYYCDRRRSRRRSWPSVCAVRFHSLTHSLKTTQHNTTTLHSLTCCLLALPWISHVVFAVNAACLAERRICVAKRDTSFVFLWKNECLFLAKTH